MDKDRMRKGWGENRQVKALAMPRICFQPFSNFNTYTSRSGRKIKAGMGDYSTVSEDRWFWCLTLARLMLRSKQG